MLPDQHADIDRITWINEQGTTAFQIGQGIGCCRALFRRNQHPFATTWDRTLMGRKALKQARQNAGAARICQKLALIADQTARRDVKDDPRLAATGWAHFGHFTFAQTHLFNHDAGKLFIHVDLGFFHRLQALAVFVFTIQHAGRPDGHFKAFAAQLLQQHA